MYPGFSLGLVQIHKGKVFDTLVRLLILGGKGRVDPVYAEGMNGKGKNNMQQDQGKCRKPFSKRVCEKRRSGWFESLEHQVDHCYMNPRFAGFRQFLEILAEPSAAAPPRQGTLIHPPAESISLSYTPTPTLHQAASLQLYNNSHTPSEANGPWALTHPLTRALG